MWQCKGKSIKRRKRYLHVGQRVEKQVLIMWVMDRRNMSFYEDRNI